MLRIVPPIRERAAERFHQPEDNYPTELTDRIVEVSSWATSSRDSPQGVNTLERNVFEHAQQVHLFEG